MERARKIHFLDSPVLTPPIRLPIPFPRLRSRAVPRRGIATERAAGFEEQAAQERCCGQCRHARVDRVHLLGLCTSTASESAHRQVFSGQEACGWFEMRKRVLGWPLYAARKL
jgi:hypothetical protein